MTAAWDDFRRRAADLRPRAAAVFGSGLGAAAAGLEAVADVPFADVPGLAPPTVAGHSGRVVLGRWNGAPVVVSLGRTHAYEGHAAEDVAALVHRLADLGIERLLLTNAAGGVRPGFRPGTLMAIHSHILLRGPDAWKDVAPRSPYRPEETARLVGLSESAGEELPAGVYVAWTGPSYETPAEVRAVLRFGGDAVGMSTALEAEAAAARGLAVAGLSCVTNAAAGLGDGPLSHGEVEVEARRAVGRVGRLTAAWLAAS